MSMIDVKNLSFAYEGSPEMIFDNVSFRLDTDWKLGFTGRNGRGKTTFLKLLAGRLPCAGTISADADFRYFPFEPRDPGAPASEALRSAAGAYEDWRLLRETGLLGLSPELLARPFSTLSNGEQTKLALAVLFAGDGGFLLIDEPTNHLDLAGRQAVSRYLNAKKGFILVSHDRDFLDGCVDHMLSIDRADITVQKGNFSSWQRSRALQDSFELEKNERLKKDIKRLEGAVKRTADWSDRVEKTKYGTKNSGLRPDTGYIGHKSAKMMKRSKAIENRRRDALEEKTGLLRNLEDSEALKLVPLKFRSERLAELKDVSLRYGERTACAGVSFALRQGDRLALCGKNGSGKSSVLKLFCGGASADEGTFFMASGLVVSCVPQDSAGLSGSLGAFERERELDASLFRAMLRKLGLSRADFEKDLADYSEGMKKKALLAGSLSQRAHLYVWDEPLNYIDVISRMQLEALILDCRPTLLFVEHDAAFCRNVATGSIEL
ncbi:MAG: ATP-binding cassette domain-containing protein [Oscillospiraceae bacterium]|nr:ATP-binding cassette domain-containing protein [Oscillospiraceae bacterium]